MSLSGYVRQAGNSNQRSRRVITSFRRRARESIHETQASCRHHADRTRCDTGHRGSRRGFCHRQRQHAVRPEHAISGSDHDPCRHTAGDQRLPQRNALVRRFLLRWSRLGRRPVHPGNLSIAPHLCRPAILPSARHSDRHLQCRRLLGSLLSKPRLLPRSRPLAARTGLEQQPPGRELGPTSRPEPGLG